MSSYNPQPKHLEARELLGGPATYVLLYGGSRSGKTFEILRSIVERAMAAPDSSHAIFRHTFNSLRSSIIEGPSATMPMVLKPCFPELVNRVRLDKANWCLVFPNGSRIYYGGLDDKLRTEKVLGPASSRAA